MSRTRALRAPRFAALAGVVLGFLLPALAAPTAAYAESTDLAASLTQSALSGASGETAYVTAWLTNVDGVNDSGPTSLVLAVSGSSVLSLVAPGGTCDIASTTCTFLSVGAGYSMQVDAQLQLSTSGSVSATAVLAAGADGNPANDTASIPVTVAAPPAPALVSLTASPHPVRAGTPLHLAVTLTDAASHPLSGESIDIVSQPYGAAAFSRIISVYTDSLGRANWDDYPTATTTYRAQYTASYSNAAGSAASTDVVAAVTYAVTAATSPVTVPPGSLVTLTIVVRSGTAGTPVTLQRKVGTGPWQSIAHPTLRAGGKAAVRLPTLTKVGLYSYRVIRAADASHAAGTAQARVSVTTTGKGSAAAWTPLVGTKAAPGRWNPCAPIVYYVNPRHMPANGLSDLREALRRVSLAGGLTFRYGGAQNVVPTPGYHGPAGGGILIAWATGAESQGLLPPYADGLGGGGQVFGRRIVSGYVLIDANAVKPGREAPGFGAGSPQGLVLMHELGHVVGLGHVSDAWSIMQPGSPLPASVWGAGDIAGLRALGRPAGCL